MIQKQKGNSGYLNKRQLKKKINPGNTLLEESDADQNPHHAAAGIRRRKQILQSEWMEKKNKVTRSCIWGISYAVCLPVVSFVSLTVFGGFTVARLISFRASRQLKHGGMRTGDCWQELGDMKRRTQMSWMRRLSVLVL